MGTMMKQVSKWLIFGLMAMAQFMVVLDTVIATVALPAMQQTLHFNNSTLQWVVTAYALTFGGFLLLGGRAADLFGRRRTLLIGMIAFTLVSLGIGLAQSPEVVIILRAIQGLSAALMSPAALSIVLTTFKEGADRNKALGFWTIVATGGAAVGLMVGGLLSQYLNWRWNFLINLPIGILTAIAIYRVVPKHASEAGHKDLDLPGAALVTGGLIALVYAISNATIWGWLSLPTLGISALAAVLLGGFIWNESRSKHPLMPLSIFKIRNVTGANLIMAPVFAGVMGMFFLSSIYMQNVLHYSPVMAGLAFLPFPVIVGLMSNKLPKLVPKFGYKPFLVLGTVLAGLGILWLSRLPVHGTYFVDILPTLLLLPMGMGMIFMPLMAAATSGVPANEAGLASGLINTSQQMGGALGLAILSGIAASTTLAATNTAPLVALVHGFNIAFLVGALFMAFATTLAVIVIKQPRKERLSVLKTERVGIE
jgi:EmrB/QacA subfamily drug resistance transporter